jgi:hypothetical protein
MKININTPIFIFSSGIFTKKCGTNSTPTKKCRLCFLGHMSIIPVTTVSKGTTYLLPLKRNEKNI